MFAPPPKTTRIIINSMNCEKLSEFYSDLGMLFSESNIDGKKHFTYVYDDFYLEIREVTREHEITRNLELRFFIDEIEGYREDIKKYELEIIKDLWITENHKHILFKDPNDNTIELITQK